MALNQLNALKRTRNRSRAKPKGHPDAGAAPPLPRSLEASVGARHHIRRGVWAACIASNQRVKAGRRPGVLWTGERRTARRGADALRGAYPDHPPMGGQPPPGFRLRMPAGLRACPPPRLLICTAFLAAVGCCTRNASARDGERQEAGGAGRPGSAGGIVDRSTASREPGRQRAGPMRRGWRLAHIDKSHDEEHEELVGAHREGHDARQCARLLRDRARPDVRHAAARRGEQSARQGVAALPLLPRAVTRLGRWRTHRMHAHLFGVRVERVRHTTARNVLVLGAAARHTRRGIAAAFASASAGPHNNVVRR